MSSLINLNDPINNPLKFRPDPVDLPAGYEQSLHKDMMAEFFTMNVFRLDEPDGVEQLLITAARHDLMHNVSLNDLDSVLLKNASQPSNSSVDYKPLTTSVEWAEQLIQRRHLLAGAFVTGLPYAPNKDCTEGVNTDTHLFDDIDQLVSQVKDCLQRQERVYLYIIFSSPQNEPMLRWAHYL